MRIGEWYRNEDWFESGIGMSFSFNFGHFYINTNFSI